uniref:Uncharacterized protein n=1 Tax=Candidatus Kentrum sp. TC TaxID=2126339 RepID=A0A450ZCH7_9GAMM|nr:MAG: hypothetical protein BECKTC1821D_GA0114238_100153 [Candidatus Kentron sp. TC]VFK51487.1 MAG: hypothetical protein BECKTC1821F_GA0114240_1001111 [Candidatus Kentron sp. TC]
MECEIRPLRGKIEDAASSIWRSHGQFPMVPLKFENFFRYIEWIPCRKTTRIESDSTVERIRGKSREFPARAPPYKTLCLSGRNFWRVIGKQQQKLFISIIGMR